MDEAGGRKFIYALIITIAASIFLSFGYLTGNQWIETIKWIGGFFLAGNLIEKGIEKIPQG